MITTNDAILGFEALWPGELILILLSGIEFYSQKDSQKDSWIKVKKIEFTIHWYSVEQDFMLISKQSKEFSLYKLNQGHNALKLDTLKLSLEVPVMNGIQKRHFLTCYMRGILFIGVLDAFTDVNIHIIVYKWIKGKLKYFKSLLTGFKSDAVRDLTYICEKDYLLIVNASNKNYEIFDLFSPDINSVVDGEIDLSGSFQFIGKFLRDKKGLYYSLSVDFKQLVEYSKPSQGLVSILIGQENAKEYLVQGLIGMIRKNVGSREMGLIFNMINSCCQVPTLKQSSSFDSLKDALKTSEILPSVLSRTIQYMGDFYGYSSMNSNYEKSPILNQEDMFALVFTSFSQNQALAYGLSNYLYAYIRSLILIKQIPAPFLSELLGELYISENRLPELNMLIHHHILPDSVILAQYIIDASDSIESSSFQIGVDMLKRLAEYEKIISALLSKNMITEALAYANSINQPELIIPIKILDLAYLSGSKMLFFTTFKWVESVGQIPTVFQSDDQINRYVSIFREMWADYVYLESVD